MPKNKYVIHLPIDVQERYYKEFRDERSKTFPRKIDVFSRELKNRGIETLPVAYSNKYWNDPVGSGLYNAPFNRKFGDKNIFDALTFAPDFYPADSQAVYVKNHENAFKDDVLAKEVKKRGINTIIITGMNTTACVESTVVGAFEKCSKEVCIVIVYDMLCDNALRCDRTPQHHKARIEGILSSYEAYIHLPSFRHESFQFPSSRVRLLSSDDVLNEFMPQPEPKPVEPISFAKRIRNLLALPSLYRKLRS